MKTGRFGGGDFGVSSISALSGLSLMTNVTRARPAAAVFVSSDAATCFCRPPD
jgi:hypothetical protein